MRHTKFKLSELSGSEEEDVFIYFLCIQLFIPRTARGVANFESETCI